MRGRRKERGEEAEGALRRRFPGTAPLSSLVSVLWSRHVCGCLFAPQLRGKRRLRYAAIDPDVV